MSSIKEETTMFDTSYGLHVTLAKGTKFDEAVEQVKVAFKSQGFGLPPGTTNLDMAGIFKKKGFDFDCPNFRILGFCSPPHAFKVISTEKSAGLLVPCNVVIASSPEDERIEVAAVEPYALIGILKNKDTLKSVVDEVRAGIQKALRALVK